MKIAVLSDVHLRATKPTYRVEGFVDQQFTQLDQMVDELNEAGIELLLLAGDVFESAHEWKILARTIKAFKRFKGEINAIWGNHDLINHNYNSIGQTPLYALEEALDNFCLLPARKACFTKDGVDVYAGHWEQPIVQPIDDDNYKILLVHTMVIDEKLWHDQEHYETGPAMMKLGYDLVVSGHNHQQFTMKVGRGSSRRLLVNSGSLMRDNVKQLDATPAYYVVDTEARTTTKCPFNIQPAEDVFKLDAIEQKKESEEQLGDFSAFIEGLVSGHGMWLDFEGSLHKAIHDIDDDKDRELIKDYIGGLDVESKK